jgi:hypothetical protein
MQRIVWSAVGRSLGTWRVSVVAASSRPVAARRLFRAVPAHIQPAPTTSPEIKPHVCDVCLQLVIVTRVALDVHVHVCVCVRVCVCWIADDGAV